MYILLRYITKAKILTHFPSIWPGFAITRCHVPERVKWEEMQRKVLIYSIRVLFPRIYYICLSQWSLGRTALEDNGLEKAIYFQTAREINATIYCKRVPRVKVNLTFRQASEGASVRLRPRPVL